MFVWRLRWLLFFILAGHRLVLALKIYKLLCFHWPFPELPPLSFPCTQDLFYCPHSSLSQALSSFFSFLLPMSSFNLMTSPSFYFILSLWWIASALPWSPSFLSLLLFLSLSLPLFPLLTSFFPPNGFVLLTPAILPFPSFPYHSPALFLSFNALSFLPPQSLPILSCLLPISFNSPLLSFPYSTPSFPSLHPSLWSPRNHLPLLHKSLSHSGRIQGSRVHLHSHLFKSQPSEGTSPS